MTVNIHKKSTKAEITEALKEEGFDAPEGDSTRDELLELLGNITGTDYSRLSSSKKAVASAVQPRKMIKIVIPSGDTKLNQDDVFVGVNGVNYLIQRDVEVDVPEAVVEVLRGSKQTLGRQLDDGSIQYRQVLTYPFSIIG